MAKYIGKDPYCLVDRLKLTIKAKFNFKVKIYPILSATEMVNLTVKHAVFIHCYELALVCE